MNENNELLNFIYEDSGMACYTLTELLKELEKKDNKIKKTIENILKGYERYHEQSNEIIENKDVKGKETSLFTKMGASIGIKKEVLHDNSDSSIADMLIKGISMGTIDMEKHLHNYNKEADKHMLKFAKEFYEFQQDNLEALKKHL